MPYVVPPMENRIIRMGMSTSSLPWSFFTRTAMPLSKAPVLVMTPRKPPKIMTKKQTSSAPPGNVSGFAAPATIPSGAPVKP